MKHEDLIKSLSLEEKASLTTGKNFWETRNIDHAGIKSIFFSDGPSGLRKQAGSADQIGLNESIPATCFPSAAAMANSWDLEIEEKIGEALGKEAAANSVNVVLGPGICIKRNPMCGRNFEYFSEDPYLAGKMAAACVKGIQKNNVAACVKHYAANNQEERRLVIDTIVDERTLREIYLTAFEIAIKESKPKVLMSSYNMINGVHANENNLTMKKILRDEWGFEGVAITDWGGENNRVEGLKCHNELEMPSCANISDKQIVEAVKSGKIPESLLDECVDNLLTLIDNTNITPTKISIDEHHQLAREVAANSAVLLKNEDNILPLDSSKKIAFIGDFIKTPRYQGAGSSIVNPTKLENTFDVLKEHGTENAIYSPGFERFGKANKKLLDDACNLAKDCDAVVLYLGLDEKSEIEGVDRKNISLPKNQIDLLKAVAAVNKNIVVVLSCGCVVEMPWISDTKGLLFASLAGQAGAGAVLDIIFGKINPSGKLSETFPLHYEDEPSAPYFPGHQVSVEYRESIFVGYRYFCTAEKNILFPFGFGMSYTNFKYSDLVIAENQVSFTITNTGNRAGSEIAQLYIGKNDSQIFRASRELKGFSKVKLESGESKKIVIPFDEYSFRYFNVATGKWETESGSYKIEIGASCSDIRLNGEIAKVGTTEIIPYDKNKLPSYFSKNLHDVPTEEFEKLLGHKAPNPKWDKSKPLGYNDTFSQMFYAKGITGKLGYVFLHIVYRWCKLTHNETMVNNFDMSFFHMPFRNIVQMSGGKFSFEMLDGLLMMVNGHLFKGMSHFSKAQKAMNSYLENLPKT